MPVVPDSGPHIVRHLQGRVESLTAKLEAAHERICELEATLGIGDNLVPLRALGFTEREAAWVQALMRRGSLSVRQAIQIAYADDYTRAYDVDGANVVKSSISRLRTKLRRMGVDLPVERSRWEPYRLTEQGMARLQALMVKNFRQAVE